MSMSRNGGFGMRPIRSGRLAVAVGIAVVDYAACVVLMTATNAGVSGESYVMLFLLAGLAPILVFTRSTTLFFPIILISVGLLVTIAALTPRVCMATSPLSCNGPDQTLRFGLWLASAAFVLPGLVIASRTKTR
jgi:hypothetical protein